MEPQTEITNPPEQNQVEPPKESLRSMLASPRYWLAALLPLLCILAGVLIYYMIESKSPWDDPLLLILPPVFGVVISFAVNYFFPFATNIRRAIYADLPVLILSIVLIVIVTAGTGSSPYFIIIILYVLSVFLVLNTLLVVFGLLGAKASGFRYRWWIFSAVLLAFLVVAFLVIRTVPCTTCPAQRVQ